MARKKQTLETAFDRLEEIISIIEAGDIELEKSLKLYKEGVELSAFCNESLASAEQQVSLLKKSSDGFILEPFEKLEE